MPIITTRKRQLIHRRRRLLPRKRIFKSKSLYPRRTIYIHKGRFRLFKHRTQRQRFFRRFNTYILPTRRPKKKKTEYKPREKDFKKTITKTKTDWKPEKTKWNEVWKTEGYKDIYKKRERDFLTVEEAKKKIRKNFTNWIDEDYKRTLERYMKTDWRSKGTARFRQYQNYGPMKALGPKLIFELIPSHRFVQYAKTRRGTESYQRMVKQTREVIEKVLDGLIEYTKIIVNKYVPKETGDLREAMIESIEESKIHNFRLRVELSTKDIKYANVVNNMPQDKIRHFANQGIMGRRSKRLLDDPKAVKGWFQFIDMQLNTHAHKLLKIMFRELMVIWAVRGNTARTKNVLPRNTNRNIYRNNQSMEELETQRRLRRVQLRENIETRKRGATVVYPEYRVVKGWFDIKGLNKR